MANIIVLGASSSSKSINRQLANYAATLLDSGVTLNHLDLNDFDMPIYSSDYEEEKGVPEAAKTFIRILKEADGGIISFAEHNGSYSAAFKNVMDWVSREDHKVWTDKTLLMLSTSPGGRGGKTVLGTAVDTFGRFGAKIAAHFSLPSFNDNFSSEVTNAELKTSLTEAVKTFETALTGKNSV